VSGTLKFHWRSANLLGGRPGSYHRPPVGSSKAGAAAPLQETFSFGSKPRSMMWSSDQGGNYLVGVKFGSADWSNATSFIAAQTGCNPHGSRWNLDRGTDDLEPGRSRNTMFCT